MNRRADGTAVGHPAGHGVVGIIGVGAIAEAMVVGLLLGDEEDVTVVLSPRGRDRSSQLSARYLEVQVAADNQAVADRADLLILAVRPQSVEDVLAPLHFRPDQPIISVVADLSRDDLQRQVNPARVVARAIPLPAVSERHGLTALWPADARAVALFERLGETLDVEDESALEHLSTASGAIASGIAYVAAVQGWLMARGMVAADASRYVAALFAPVLGLLEEPPDDLTDLTRDHTTRGGLNERFLESLRARGVFISIEQALDELSDLGGAGHESE